MLLHFWGNTDILQGIKRFDFLGGIDDPLCSAIRPNYRVEIWICFAKHGIATDFQTPSQRNISSVAALTNTSRFQ